MTVKILVLTMLAIGGILFPSSMGNQTALASTGGSMSLGTTVSSQPAKGDEMQQILITIGTQAFSAKLYKNAATEALIKQFPLTLDMGELNGNEKYHYLANPLPANAQSPFQIHSGDLMLYGSDCVVLFYESFPTSCSYTPLGYVEDASGLAEALGRGNIQVTFRLN